MQNALNQNSIVAKEETNEIDRQRDLIEKLELRLQREVEIHASLSDKLDQFEVANAQLQAENETINEYVTLYREQRAALKQMQYRKVRKIPSKYSPNNSVITSVSDFFIF